MARAVGVTPPLVLPVPPEKYDVQDQRELRQLLQKQSVLIPDWSAVASVPTPVTAFGALTGAADTVPYFTGVSAMALATLTPYARTILACANAAALKTVIGPIVEADMSLSDVTTLNVSTTRHGFAPKAPNDATRFLDGTGAYSVPPAGSFPLPLPAFPSISNLVGRFSAEPTVSTLTINTDGFVAQINDASGAWGSNFTPAPSTTKPRWLKRAMNGARPGIVFDGSTTKMIAGATKVVAQPLTVVVVCQNWKGGTANNNLFRDSGGGPVVFQTSGTQWSLFAGSSLSSTTLMSQNTTIMPDGLIAAPTVVMAVFNGASSILGNNGVEVTGAGGATGISGTMTLGGDSTTSFAHMIFYEILFFSKALSSTERTQINTYYATALDINL